MPAVDVAFADPLRTRLRGRLHQVAFITSIPLGVTLVAFGRTGVARASGAIYALSLITLYGVSAAYHRLPWTPGGRRLMRRLDHSSIFFLIAGSYTPLSMLVLDGAWRVAIFATVWGVALLGVALKLFHMERTERIGTFLYIALGWTAIAALPELLGSLGAAETALLFAGGVLFTVGAVMFTIGRPEPAPGTFGYHEVWHAAVILGSLCHYTLILLLLLGAD